MLGIIVLAILSTCCGFELRPVSLPEKADGRGTGVVEARWRFPLFHRSVRWELVEGSDLVSVLREDGGFMFQAGARAGRVKIRASAGGCVSELVFELRPANDDGDGDGFPDVAELPDEADREAFRSWFAIIGASQSGALSPAWNPAERDCAGLARFAYREAMRRHDPEWQGRTGIELRPPLPPDVRRYGYPDVPVLGDRIFRTAEGFSAFADAETILKENVARISRELSDALPADLLIFENRPEGRMPYHIMIVIDRPVMGGEKDVRVVYHTGPSADSGGELRLLKVESLLKHPDTRWHPLPHNPRFLGVFRWRILK